MAGRLVPSSASSFEQSGQVDWVALTSSTISFSVGILARWSKAGVDGFTLEVGKALCSLIVVPTETQKQVHLAINKLKAYPLFDNLLQLGFGIEYIMPELAKTEQGLTLVILCSALALSYHPFFCAQVLRELCLQKQAPDVFRPSLSQWQALIKVCSGVLIRSAFELKLRGLHLHIKGPTTTAPSKMPTATSIAESLVQLSDLQRGSTGHCMIMEEGDCLWLAAFAEWVFGLNILIEDDHGERWYQTQGQGFSYNRAMFILQSQRPPESQVIIKERSFKSGRSLVTLTCEAEDLQAQRVQSTWSNILRDSFGDLVDILLDGPASPYFAAYLMFQHAVGYPAREYVLEEQEPSVQYRESMVFMRDKQKVKHFYDSAGDVLPELQDCLRRHASKSSSPETDTGEAWRERLGSFCRHAEEAREHCDHSGESFCFLAVTDAISEYLEMLLLTDIDEDVLPVSRGLYQLYFEREQRALHQSKDHRLPQATSDRVHAVLTGNKEVNLNGQHSLFNRTEIDQRDGPYAIAGQGICVFRSFLEDPLASYPSILKLKAIRGYISFESSTYDSIVHKPGTDLCEGQKALKPYVQKQSSIANMRFRVFAQESRLQRQLEVFYKMHCPQLDIEGSWPVLPTSRYTHAFMSIKHPIHCQGSCEPVYVFNEDKKAKELMATLNLLKGIPEAYLLSYISSGCYWEPGSLGFHNNNGQSREMSCVVLLNVGKLHVLALQLARVGLGVCGRRFSRPSSCLNCIVRETRRPICIRPPAGTVERGELIVSGLEDQPITLTWYHTISLEERRECAP